MSLFSVFVPTVGRNSPLTVRVTFPSDAKEKNKRRRGNETLERERDGERSQ